MRLFLCGDVMTGRGLDQIFRASCDPRLHERHVRSATRYVELAEEAHGPIATPVDHGYPWGDLSDVLRRRRPHLRIVNLETAVTTADAPWRGKGIHYRTHPDNVGVLGSLPADCCALSNNHVLDWGREGLGETLETLRRAGIATAGAGRSREEACRPARLQGPNGRVLVFALGTTGAGIPAEWSARRDRAGVCLLPELDPATARRVAAEMAEHRRPGDRVVASIHWGTNWGYRIPERQRRFARALVGEGAADVIHGHSSHHPRAMEVVDGRPVLYGCGDFLNDYEGISGHERFRGDLTLAYLLDLEPDGRLRRLEMVPFRIRRFRLERPPEEDVSWIHARMDRECRELGCRVERDGDRLLLRPGQGADAPGPPSG